MVPIAPEETAFGPIRPHDGIENPPPVGGLWFRRRGRCRRPRVSFRRFGRYGLRWSSNSLASIVPADGLEAARKLGEGALIAMLRRSSSSLRAVFTRQSHDHVSAERHLALPGGRRRGDADRAPAPAARNPSVGSQSCNLPALSRRSNIAIVECPSPSLTPLFVVFVPFLLVVQENDDHGDDRE